MDAVRRFQELVKLASPGIHMREGADMSALTSFRVGGIAQVLCDETARFLGCDSVAVLLLNPETSRLEIVAGRGDPFHDRAAREIEDDIVASVLRSGIGEIVNDVGADPRSLAARNDLRSIVCSPLRSPNSSGRLPLSPL